MKKILIIALIIVGILALVPLLLDSRVEIIRSVEIKSPIDATFAHLKDLNTFKSWNPFLAEEPGAAVVVTGEGVGARYEWKGDKTGSGKMTISNIVENSSIAMEMVFIEPFPGSAQVEWRTKEASGGTEVSWSMVQNYSYFHRYFNLIMPGMMNKMFDKGLAKLKSDLEG